MTALACPLSPHDIRVSLAVAAVVRAKARQASADAAVTRALVQARGAGLSEADIDAAARLLDPMLSPESQSRAVAILNATGSRAEESDEPIREQIADMDDKSFREMLWLQGWRAAVWTGVLDVSRWSGPADQWKARLYAEGFNALGEVERHQERARRQAGAVKREQVAA